MAHINLLPWRAARRKQREREFYGQLVMAGVIGLLVVIVWAVWMGRRIDNQHQRNAYLQGQIDQVEAKITKIEKLKQVRTQLLKRKHIIEKLQSSRSQMVHLFDSLVTTIPDSVRLTSLNQNGTHLELEGVAQSNASVAEYMRHLDNSPWLGSPGLKKTVNNHDGSRTPYSFGLGLALSKPADAKREVAERQNAKAGATATSASVAPATSVTVKHAAPAAAATSGSATAVDAAAVTTGRGKS
ncbi:MAG TPA: PilN domain-containing protein [Oleiagrimonas sp.]|nr:PilN domain-containing protein [Oleiagrimonas sp.]